MPGRPVTGACVLRLRVLSRGWGVGNAAGEDGDVLAEQPGKGAIPRGQESGWQSRGQRGGCRSEICGMNPCGFGGMNQKVPSQRRARHRTGKGHGGCCCPVGTHRCLPWLCWGGKRLTWDPRGTRHARVAASSFSPFTLLASLPCRERNREGRTRRSHSGKHGPCAGTEVGGQVWQEEAGSAPRRIFARHDAAMATHHLPLGPTLPICPAAPRMPGTPRGPMGP